MNKSVIFPLLLLFFLPGTGIRKYDHSYRAGRVTLHHFRLSQPDSHSKCQLDFSIVQDSLIIGRFRLIDPPADCTDIPAGTFQGVIRKQKEKAGTSAESAHSEAEWKTDCRLEGLDGHIRISKWVINAKLHDHFFGLLESAGTLANRSEIRFYLE